VLADRHRLPFVPIDLSRRDVLRLGLVTSAGAGLAACTTASSSGTPTQTDPGGPEDPDSALRADVAADEARLTALYAAAAKVLTGATAARTSALGERHAAYRAAVAPASASSSPSGSASASPTVPAVTAATALKVLVAAEAAAATSRATQAARAADPELARVIVLAGTGAASAAAALSAARAR
jgi:hypothetical protein